MGDNINCIVKSGIVESIGENTLIVIIHNSSACSACHSKGVCSSFGSGDRIIEVEKDGHKKVEPGDRVNIHMISSSGWKAVVLGYIIPFFILMTTLVISNSFIGEALSAILSLVILFPYYLILYLLRNRMKKLFRFTLA